jgi:uncharacterized membrane protein YdbT with pleckstrin-like domain
MERTGTTCGNGHSFDGVTDGIPCPICGSRNRIFHVPGSVIAGATASGSLTTEMWKELYERHGRWLLATGLLSVISALVTRLLLSGWAALVVWAVLLIVSFFLARRGYAKKRVRVIEHHS